MPKFLSDGFFDGSSTDLTVDGKINIANSAPNLNFLSSTTSLSADILFRHDNDDPAKVEVRDSSFKIKVSDTTQQYDYLVLDGSNSWSYFPTGNVGINTTQPEQSLHVAGNFRLENQLYDSTNFQGSFGQILSKVSAGTKWIDQSDVIAGEADKAKSVILRVKNSTASAMSKGQVICEAVSLAPPNGNLIEVALADNNGINTMPALGILNDDLDAAGGNNDEGDAIMFGKVSGIDTSAFSVGDEVFVDDTPGGLTATKPTGVKYIQKVGVVIRDDDTNGTIEVFGAGRTNDVPTPLYIDHLNQRVGIGEIDPDYKLHIDAPSGGFLKITESGVDRLTLNSNNEMVLTSPSNWGGYFKVGKNVGTSEVAVELGEGRTGNGTSRIDFIGDTTYADYGFRIIRNNGGANTTSQLVHRGTGNFELVSNDSGDIILNPNNGNVGIGVTGPGTKLDVAGDGRFTGRVYTNTNGTDTVGILGKARADGWASRYDSNNNNFSGFYFNTNNESIIIGRNSSGDIVNYIHANGSSYFKGGSVGIGTTSPQEKLHVQNYTTGESHQAMFKGGAVAVGDYSYVSLNNGYSTEYNKEVRLAAVSELSNSNKTGFAILTSPDSSGASGHERLRVTADGEVGIGTDSPGAKLEVDSNDAFRTVQLTGTTPAIYFNEDDSASTDNWHLGVNGGALYFLRDTDKSGAYNNIAAYFSGNNLISEGSFYAKGNTFSFGASISEGEYISRSGNDIRFIAGEGTRMSVDGDNGYIGIGYTDPQEKLHVYNGSAYITPIAYAANQNDWVIRAGAYNNTAFDQGLKLKSNGDGVSYMAFETAHDGGETMVLRSGKVGIGTADPGEKLDVAGNIKSTGTIYAGYNSGQTNSISCSNWFRTNGNTGIFFATHGGGLYMTDTTYVTVYNNKAFEVNNTGTSSIRSQGDIVAYYSDERLKTNLGNITNAVDKVKKLNGFYYKNNELANSFGYTEDHLQVGVSAQEVEAIMPEVVKPAPFDFKTKENGEGYSASGENYKTVKYEKLVPLLIEAIKEQQKQIDELKKQLDASTK